MNTNRTPSSHYTSVIVFKGMRDGNQVGIYTRVKHHNFEPFKERNQPSNYAEAVLFQMPKIEKAMNSLARKLVKCGIDGSNDAILHILKLKLERETVKQVALGSEAAWNLIEYNGADNPFGTNNYDNHSDSMVHTL